MKKLIIFAIASALALPLCAEDSLKQDIKDAWDTTKKEVKKAGAALENKVEELTNKDETPADSKRVAVNLNEYGITMPASLEPGKTSFVVTNSGKENHSFEIDGPGLDKELARTLKPGETSTLTTTLQTGTYEVECPVANHDDKGMKRLIEVK